MSCRELTRLCCRINLCVKERSGSTNSVLRGNFLAFLLRQPCSLFHGLLSLTQGWFWCLGALSFHYLPNCLTFCLLLSCMSAFPGMLGLLLVILHTAGGVFPSLYPPRYSARCPVACKPAVHCLVSVLVRLSPRLEYDGGCASLARVMASSTRSS